MAPLSRRVVLASGNAGKLAELRALLAGLPFEVVAQSELGVAEAEEPAVTFVENALIKARNAAASTGLAAIADDSGLAVDALDGAPGVRSARFSGPDATDASNRALLLARLAGVADEARGACFVSVVVYLRDAADPLPIVAEGRWPGRIAQAERGSGGFGYDALFHCPVQGATAAELDAAEKNRWSHRGRALAVLRERLAAD